MNRRIKKKIERRKRQMVHQMLDLVLDINGLCVRKQKVTGDAPTAFFEFSGHVSKVEAEIYKCGWRAGRNADAYYGYYTDAKYGKSSDDGRECARKLRETRDMLSRRMR